MSRVLVDDQLWESIQPLLSRSPRRRRNPGRKRIDNRLVLNGILFVLTTGIAWQRLPQELGFGSGLTCWRRLRDWHQAGVFARLHQLLLARLRQNDQPLPSGLRFSLPARAFGGRKTGPSPVDRARAGSTHHLIAHANGIPLACLLTGAIRHDVTQLLPLVEAIPPVQGKRGRPRRRPRTLLADRAYHSQASRQSLRTLGIKPVSLGATQTTDSTSAANAGPAHPLRTQSRPSTKPSSTSPAASSA